jgi:hypothetical protein
MLETNKLALQLYYPDLYKKMNEITLENFLYNIHPAKNGQMTFAVQKREELCYLHSRYNPEREVEQWVHVIETDADIIVVVGIGLGHALPHLAVKFEGRKVVVVEPDLHIFSAVLAHVDFSTWLKDDSFTFLVGCDAFLISYILSELIWNNMLSPDSVYITAFPVYERMNPNFVKTIKEQISVQWMNLQVQEATHKRFSKAWITTTLKNISYINRDMSAAYISEALHNLPVILIAAGPSLEKNIHILKRLQNRAVLFAVGSAVNILESNGIEPHIIMAIDSAESERNIFARTCFSSALLLYTQMLHPDIVHMYPGPKAWVKLKEDKGTEYVCKRLNIPYIEAADGPSVANVAFDFISKQLRPSAIILVGQDLAYTNDQTHARGAVHDTSVKLDEEGFILLEDVEGNMVRTTSGFIAMKNFFEVYMQYEQPSVPVYNCTEGGLPIRGIPNYSLIEIAEKECKHTLPIQEIMQKIKGHTHKEINPDTEKALWHELQQAAHTIHVLSEKRSEKLRNLSPVSDSFSIQFDEIKHVSRKIEEHVIYQHMIEPYVQWLIDASNRRIQHEVKKSDDIIKTKEKLLKELLAQYMQVHEYIELFRKTVEEILYGTVPAKD